MTTRTPRRAITRVTPLRGGTKVDIYEILRHEYVTPRTPVLIDISRGTYLAVSGRGEPGGTAFIGAVGALYSVAFAVKMLRKRAGSDFTVSKLEGLWWADRRRGHVLTQPRSLWQWRLLIRVPDFVKPKEVDQTIDDLIAKGKPREVRHVALEHLHEGRCIQLLHVGPWATEPASIEIMRAFAAEQGMGFNGVHHEIYLSDPRRVAPARLRTILRVPIARHAGEG